MQKLIQIPASPVMAGAGEICVFDPNENLENAFLILRITHQVQMLVDTMNFYF